ncbi:MAG: hypothetical protein OES57_19040, partial [Acidimicrobiia bacterium]|nr:hypothetical protein [Acidimicrobiia bacterium]
AGVDRPAFTESMASLAPVLAGAPADADRVVFTFDRTGVNLAARRSSLKYIRSVVDGAEVLYDLESDPAETVNHVDDPAHAAALGELRAAADRYSAAGIPDLPYFDR